MNDDSDTTESPAAEGMAAAGAPDSQPAPAWEALLDEYPTRPAEQDPRWALRLFWIWVVVADALILFIVALLILGWFYD